MILLMSICIPVLLNLIVILIESPKKVKTKGKIILASISFLSQSVVGYVKTRLQIVNEKKNSNFKELGEGTLEEEIRDLEKLQAKLKINEGIFESSVQAAVLLIAITFHFRCQSYKT